MPLKVQDNEQNIIICQQDSTLCIGLLSMQLNISMQIGGIV
jgi:hypothetical protein